MIIRRNQILTESFKNLFSYVGFRVGVKRAVFSGNFIIGVFRVEHAESVVVLSVYFQKG